MTRVHALRYVGPTLALTLALPAAAGIEDPEDQIIHGEAIGSDEFPSAGQLIFGGTIDLWGMRDRSCAATAIGVCRPLGTLPAGIHPQHPTGHRRAGGSDR